MTSAQLNIGIDLGGTKIAAMAFLPDGSATQQLRIATPVGDYDATIAVIAKLVGQLEQENNLKGVVGMGIPGSEVPTTGRVQNANSTWLNNRSLADDLRKVLTRPVKLANDANCFALSETYDGAAKNADSVIGVILGTGCGAGVVINGTLMMGQNHIAGEWGHNPLPWPQADEIPGPKCWCGRKGCIELWISGPGLARDHLAVTGEKMTAREIAAALPNNAQCAASMARHCQRLARGLAHMINLIDPQMIVLGGGLSALDHLYQHLPEFIRPYIFAASPSITIVPPRHGDASGVRGAARLWSQDDAKHN